MSGIIDGEKEDFLKADTQTSDHVKLAILALESFVQNRLIIQVPDWVPEHFTIVRKATFVSIKKNGNLRGCIGTIIPTKRNLAEEIIYNAISAGTQDPRFNPIRVEELSDLIYSVDVLYDPEQIVSIKELNVKRYGVIVTKGFRRGLLLPDLEGIDTPEEQVLIALQKAGIEPGEEYSMQRFLVERFK